MASIPMRLGALLGLQLGMYLGPAALVGACCTTDPSPSLRPAPDEPQDEASFLWDQGRLQTFEILLAPEDLARLDGDPRAEKYVPADVVFDGELHAGVQAR